MLDDAGRLAGVVTRRDLLDLDLPITARVGDLIKRPAIVAFEDMSAREAADCMVRARVGRLPVVRRDAPGGVVGIVSRSDVLEATDRSRTRPDPAPPLLTSQERAARSA